MEEKTAVFVEKGGSSDSRHPCPLTLTTVVSL